MPVYLQPKRADMESAPTGRDGGKFVDLRGGPSRTPRLSGRESFTDGGKAHTAMRNSCVRNADAAPYGCVLRKTPGFLSSFRIKLQKNFKTILTKGANLAII